MQVNKKSQLITGILFLLTALAFLYGCSSSTSSISGKLTVMILGENEVKGLSTYNEDAIVEYPLLLADRSEADELSNETQAVKIPDEINKKQLFKTGQGVDFRRDFIPDEIIVKYRSELSYSLMSDSGGGYRILRSFSGRGDSGVLCLLKLESSLKNDLSDDAVSERTLLEIEMLKALPYVEYAEPNYIYRPLFSPNDKYYTLQWHYPLIKLDMVWKEDIVNDVSSVIVAVLDTGIARSTGDKTGNVHPDLDGIFVDEYDFISDNNISLDGDGYDDDATDPGDDPYGVASTFHGTHVTGTIGALTNNYTGVAGIAGGKNSGVRIMPLRVLGAGGGSTYDIAQAVLYAAGVDNSSGKKPSKPADIINMSLGGADSATLHNAIKTAYNNGILIVAAAGNSSSNYPLYPAAYEEVISVSAVDIGARRAWYSNYGSLNGNSKVDLAAPGGDFSYDLNFDSYPDGVLSTLAEQYYDQNTYYYEPRYGFYQGTSMAAPHVAGVAALVKQSLIGKSSKPEDIKNYLTGNAIDLGDPGYDVYYGHGLINAYKAVAAAAGHTISPVLFPFPKELRFEGSNPQAQKFTLKNVGNSGSITITKIYEKKSQPWVTISPSYGQVNDSDWLDVNVSINTSRLTDGKTHTALIVVESNAGTEYVYVLYNKDGFPSENIKNIGELYVVAIDPDKWKVVEMDITDYIRFYEYTISGLKAGKYIVGASSDRDDDGYLFEIDDIYGFYKNGESIDLRAGQNLTNIDFQVNGTDVNQGTEKIQKTLW
ncbi:MAG: S8 family serine peptidase [Spirochaetota bacterium]